MKPITLHPVSVLIGLALAALVLLATSAQTIGGAQAATTWRPSPGYVPAEQWTYIKIGDGGKNPTPYVVPADRRLVLTRALVALASNSLPRLNGLDATVMISPVNAVTYPVGGITRVVFQPGDVLSFSGGGIIYYWGYLEPL